MTEGVGKDGGKQRAEERQEGKDEDEKKWGNRGVRLIVKWRGEDVYLEPLQTSASIRSHPIRSASELTQPYAFICLARFRSSGSRFPSPNKEFKTDPRLFIGGARACICCGRRPRPDRTRRRSFSVRRSRSRPPDRPRRCICISRPLDYCRRVSACPSEEGLRAGPIDHRVQQRRPG